MSEPADHPTERLLHPDGRTARFAQLTLATLLAGLIALFVAGAFADPQSAPAVWGPIVITLAAMTSCAVRTLSVGRERSAWAMMSVALGVWTLGAVFQAVATGDPATMTHPNFADACTVAFYPLAYLAMVQLIRGRVTRFGNALWLDGLIGALAVAAVATGVALPPALEGEDAGLTPFVLKLIPPLGDMLLLAFIAGVMALNGWRPGRAWLILGAGFGITAIAHAVNLSSMAPGDGAAGLVAFLWPVGIALIGFSPWYASDLRAQIRLEGWSLLVAPTLFGWITVALVAYGNFEQLGPGGLGLAGATLVLVMIRTGLTFKENVTIARELHHDVAAAARDALTGLPNHRAFHELLDTEAVAADRSGQDLSVVMFDVDEMKRINERFGHKVGDEVITEVARRIAETLRGEDVLSRTGGEEFACVLPGTSGQAAWRAAERARRAVEATPITGIGEVTVSAGVCDLMTAGSASELSRLADGALYWSKIHGRNVVYRYAPDFMDVLSADERADQAERSQTLSAITALARAVDAKDGNTQRHSERVGALAADIAGRLGWSQERRARINEAGLVHDVGKIGVPDRILLKGGRLNRTEQEIMEGHATLGAQIVQDVLGAEQVLWVLHHHERWDGAGYPEGLMAEEIPEGAQILAVADAWDAMSASRHYRTALAPETVLAKLRAGSGRQWSPRAVEALVALWTEGRVLAAGNVVDDAVNERAALDDAETTDAPAGTGVSPH